MNEENACSLDRKKPPINTSAKLARLLRAEGWTDHLANECDRYVRRNRVLSVRQLRQADRIEEAMRKVTDAMSEGDKMVLGRFVGLHKGFAFEAGLRTGLGVRVQQMGEALTPEEVEQRLLPRMGTSSARYFATYHALTHGMDLPPVAGSEMVADPAHCPRNSDTVAPSTTALRSV